MKNQFYKKFLISLLIAAGIFSGSSAAYAAETEKSAIQEKDVLPTDDISDEPTQIYGIGSVSKMFTAAAVMKLAEEDKVNLDSPLTEYIPEFQMADERYKEITVRMLLNHSSGIMGTTFHNCFLLGDSDTSYHDTFLEAMKTQKLKADPGEYSVYCNDGFTLAELLVERISGMSFAQFVRQEFTEPLGMNNTYIPSDIPAQTMPAPIYYRNRALPYENIQSLASGGIYSTPEDMCRFGQIFTENGSGLLSGESMSAMANPEYKKDKICVQNTPGGFGYGLGWDNVDIYPYKEYGIPALMKGGDTGSYHAGLLVLPKQNLSVCVTSSGGSSLDCQVMAQNIVMEVLAEEGIMIETEEFKSVPEDAIAIPEELKAYAGYYAASGIWRADFTENNRLLLTSLENEDDTVQEYIYTKDGYFVSTKGDYISNTGALSFTADGVSGITKFRFSEENNGKIYMLGTTYQKASGMEQTAFAMPLAEKIEENIIADNVSLAWDERDGRKYYLAGEIYNSKFYLTLPSIKIEKLKNITGYTGAADSQKNCKIINENLAVCELDLPTMTGRDLADYVFYKIQNMEYLDFGGYTFMREDAIPPSSELKETAVINDYSLWFRIDEHDSGESLSIKVPDCGSYFVYDKNDICITSSLLEGEQPTVNLPEGGKLMLAGEPGSVFTIIR